MSVLLETSLGDVVVDTYFDIVPEPCLNFIKLCKIKYYNDCEIFRVRENFVAQTGDPLNAGEGGSSVFAQCIPPGPKYLSKHVSKRLSHAKKGTVSLTAASSCLSSKTSSSGAQGAHGSQFFITLVDNLNYLDSEHTIFGHIAEGMDVVDKLAAIPVDDEYRPLRLIRIRHTVVLHDPFEDPPGLPQDVASPKPTQFVPANRLPSDDEDEDFSIPTDADEAAAQARLEQLKKEQDEREARSRAEVLEIIGDIGDADLKPPENVLFVCKLNPVTEAEDLETIFSRFGKCSAEVIRDHDTGDSLCYAFVEFESKDHCEKAYFNMDNALIDDRRVRVDFSQSVSKLWNRNRRQRSQQNCGGYHPGPQISNFGNITSGRAVPNVGPKSHPKQVSDHFYLADSKDQPTKRRRTRFDQG